jgi:hypothetical protein
MQTTTTTAAAAAYVDPLNRAAVKVMRNDN